MNNLNTIYVGLDIDDKNFHIAACIPGKEIKVLKCKPSLGSLKGKLENLNKDGFHLKVCYEASYLGYSLCRDLIKAGYDCEIIAPSLIPEVPGKRKKTDKLDSIKIAKAYSQDSLTPIYVPDEEDEQVRNLIRSRNKVQRQLKDLRRHILSECRRNKLNYKAETSSKSHWTVKHKNWLNTQIRGMGNNGVRFNLETLIDSMVYLEDVIKKYDEKIISFAKEDKYRSKVEALNCLRFIDTHSAMTLITEIGDIRRFSHPNKLTAYSGMDISEQSSGGKENKGGITKTGNRRIRTCVVEACQKAQLKPAVGKRLKEARKNQPDDIVKIADQCMKRLHKKSISLIFKGKHMNKVKVASAREMLCFVWEILMKVAA